jgi:hypothetical protein
MKELMSLLITLLILTGINQAQAACDFKDGLKVVSLSAPISSLIEKMGLSQSSKLQGVSTFHYFEKLPKTVVRIPGGLFISEKNSAQFKKSLVFYDSSHELKQRLQRRLGFKNLVAVPTQGSPIEVTQQSIMALKPLLQNCKQEIADVFELLKKVSLAKPNPQGKKVLFYLGALKKEGKLPQMLMVADGPVKYWVNKKVIETYPSKLAYVNVSEKIKKEIGSDVIHIGLIDDEKAEDFKVDKLGPKRWNLYYRGILRPGLSQLSLVQKLNWENILK